MSSKGKHASRGPGTFYRDLAIMILGILVVGAAVFFLLYLFAERPVTGADTTTSTVADTTTTVEGETTTTVEEPATTVPDTTTTSSPVAVRPPAEVTVAVVNSTSLDGAAGRLTAELADAGYQTLPADNLTPEQDPSRIWYRDGFAAEAAVLVDFVPGATVESLPDESLREGADVVVVIGTGYTE